MGPDVRAPRDEDELRAIWTLLCRAFGWSVADFTRFQQGVPLERTLAVWIDGEPVACARLREFGQFFGGRCVAMGGYSPVGVAAEHRGRGYGSLITAAHYPGMRERGEVLSGLYPATNALYRRVGFEISGVWSSHKTRTRELQRLPLGRGTITRRGTESDHAAIEACYARVARNLPGFLDRREAWWQRIFAAEDQQIQVVDGADGAIAGYVRYTMAWGSASGSDLASLDVAELMADDPEVVHALWRLVGSSSSIAPECRIVGPPEHPLTLSLPEQDLTLHREWRWMSRIIDAPHTIAARGYPEALSLEVDLRLNDPQCDWNSGRWRLVVEGGEGRLERGGAGEVELGIGAFSSLYTGYASPAGLVAAGLLRGDDPRSRAALAAAFAGPTPWMPDFY